MTTSVTPAILQPGTSVAASATTYITGALASLTIIKQAVFTNTGTAAVTFTVYRVPNGGTAGATNTVIDGRSLGAAPATDLAPELTNMVLGPGDIIQCAAGTAAVINFFASGYVAS